MGLEVGSLGKEEIIRALAADLRLLREALPELQDPVQLRLWGRPLKELKELAVTHGIEVREGTRQAYVAALAADPGVRAALEAGPPVPPPPEAAPGTPPPAAEEAPPPPTEEAPPGPEPVPQLLPPPGDLGGIVIEPEPPEPAHVAALARALEPPRDFARLQEALLDVQAMVRGGDFAAAARTAAGAVEALAPATEAFGRWAWAEFIRSVEALARGARGPREALARVHDLLDHARDALATDRWAGRVELLRQILDATASLDVPPPADLGERLAGFRRELAEVEALGIPAAGLRATLDRAEGALASREGEATLRLLTTAAGHLGELRQRALREFAARLEALGAELAEAKALGAEGASPSAALEEAREAVGRGDLGAIRPAVERAERAVVEAHRAQLDRALEGHRRHLERVVGTARRLKPLAAEAELLGLDPRPLRASLLAALAAVKGGDYVEALLATRRAEEAARLLLPGILRERARRGVSKPSAGACGRCASRELDFDDDGWGRCRACGMEFRWRRLGPQGLFRRLGEGLRSRR